MSGSVLATDRHAWTNRWRFIHPGEKALFVAGLLAADFALPAGTVAPQVFSAAYLATVIGAKVFARKGVEKDSRSRTLEDVEKKKLTQDRDDEVKIILDAAARRAKDLLDLLGISEKTSQLPGVLSGGQRQRLSVARALANAMNSFTLFGGSALLTTITSGTFEISVTGAKSAIGS